MSKILVVDDSPDIRLALTTVLEEAGYETVEASDGTEVLGSILQHCPDIVLLDLAMPRKDGFSALLEVKKDNRVKNTPVIMVTAKGRPEDLTRSRSLGAQDYINKPWEDGEVELRVGWVLDEAGINVQLAS
jgi:DNA-binding response OmpR family regulator